MCEFVWIRKRGVPIQSGRPAFLLYAGERLVAVAVVVAVVMIAMVLAPFVALVLQAFVGLVAFVPPMISLPAVIAIALDGFMQPPIAVSRAAIAIVPIIRLRVRCACEKQKSAQQCRSQYCAAENFPACAEKHAHGTLPVWPRPAGGGVGHTFQTRREL